jgi:hypothetical protein
MEMLQQIVVQPFFYLRRKVCLSNRGHGVTQALLTYSKKICLLDFTTIMRLSFYHIFEFYILPQLCESMDVF